MKETGSKVTSTTTFTNVGTTENEVLSDQSSMSMAMPATSSSSPTQNVTNFQETKNSSDHPWNLKFWNSDEWRRINDRLDYLSTLGRSFSPDRRSIPKALEGLSPDGVRVVLVGQDPYPSAKFSTGRAFEVPEDTVSAEFPLSLKSLFSEYQADLSLPYPTVGNLSRWVSQGVLLWNCIPSTTAGESLAHDWREYDTLNAEVFEHVDREGAVYVFFGAIARRYVKYVDQTRSRVIECSHPSPRGNLNSRNPFRGSRVFSTINQKLLEIGQPPIDWRLP